MKGKFDAYVLRPLAKKFQNWIADRSTARDFTVFLVYIKNCHWKFKKKNVFGCQWFIPWLVLMRSIKAVFNGVNQVSTVHKWPPFKCVCRHPLLVALNLLRRVHCDPLLKIYSVIIMHQNYKSTMLISGKNSNQIHSYKLYFHEF